MCWHLYKKSKHLLQYATQSKNENIQKPGDQFVIIL